MRRIFERLSNPLKLTICVVSIVTTGLLTARVGGIITNDHQQRAKDRSELAEAVAINFSLLAIKEDVATMQKTMQLIVSRNESVESIGVRKSDGNLLIDVGKHANIWEAPADDKSTESHMIVPISSQDGRWGTIEMKFYSNAETWFSAWLNDPFVHLMGFMVLFCMAGLYYFFVRILRQLNPAKVIPGRVRSALDTITEGLLILDLNRNIVLANEAFGNLVDVDSEKIIGYRVNDLPWHERKSAKTPVHGNHPWDEVMDTNRSATGRVYELSLQSDKSRTFVVNASPVLGANQRAQGVLVTLEDITTLEEKKQELRDTLDQLQVHSEEIRRQNEELEQLATTDPLTECLNRRSFFKQFDEIWANVVRHDLAISVVMVDIDFFKSINDDHGHSVGDDVLRGVAATLRASARVGDLVCRFGGEEFCVLLPHTDIDGAFDVAERFRTSIEQTHFDLVSITASLGVSSYAIAKATEENVEQQTLIDQADKCLYVAKRNGRNQVVRFDDVPADLEVDETQISRTKPGEGDVTTTDIVAPTVPYRAVAALLSTLSYRHAPSAAHSQRVADLCVAMSEGMLTPRDTYNLEIAALLHDIGKIGVPDSILLKNGPLDDSDWEVMRHHDQIGAEIVRASFDCKPVTEIVCTYRNFFRRLSGEQELMGNRIPVGARILAISDAWDAMTNDRTHPEMRSHEEAIAELRKFAGSQFDPSLVERFITMVETRPKTATRFEPIVSREIALQVGQHIEALIDAMESEDMEGMSLLANRLQNIAQEDGLDEFAQRAEKLQQSILSDNDLLDILGDSQDLIEMCRSSHGVWIEPTAV